MEKPTCIWDAKAELGEGARYDPISNQLWWVDILGQKIFKLDLDSGEKTVWETPEPVGCTFAEKDGGVLALFRRSIVRLDQTHGRFETVVEFNQEPANNRFNDGTVSPDGSIWIGSMDYDFQQASGAVYRLKPTLDIERVDHGFIVVNGPAFNADGSKLYVNETMKGEIYCCDVDPSTHGLSEKRLFAKIEEGDGLPDGIYVDDAGGIWVALVTGGKVRRYLPDGTVEREISLPAPSVTSVCIGGRDGDTLFITTGRILMDDEQLAAHPQSGGLFSVKVDQKAIRAERFG
jgi:sugar lactone lactonase YvrE